MLSRCWLVVLPALALVFGQASADAAASPAELRAERAKAIRHTRAVVASVLATPGLPRSVYRQTRATARAAIDTLKAFAAPGADPIPVPLEGRNEGFIVSPGFGSQRPQIHASSSRVMVVAPSGQLLGLELRPEGVSTTSSAPGATRQRQRHFTFTASAHTLPDGTPVPAGSLLYHAATADRSTTGTNVGKLTAPRSWIAAGGRHIPSTRDERLELMVADLLGRLPPR